MMPGATYRAMDDGGQAVRALPARQCGACGYICPDADEILEMRPSRVPVSVRIRCLKAVIAEEAPLRRPVEITAPSGGETEARPAPEERAAEAHSRASSSAGTRPVRLAWRFERR